MLLLGSDSTKCPQQRRYESIDDSQLCFVVVVVVIVVDVVIVGFCCCCCCCCCCCVCVCHCVYMCVSSMYR